jgi:hypothetical protein
MQVHHPAQLDRTAPQAGTEAALMRPRGQAGTRSPGRPATRVRPSVPPAVRSADAARLFCGPAGFFCGPRTTEEQDIAVEILYLEAAQSVIVVFQRLEELDAG